jgi:hypothetical protein
MKGAEIKQNFNNPRWMNWESKSYSLSAKEVFITKKKKKKKKTTSHKIKDDHVMRLTEQQKCWNTILSYYQEPLHLKQQSVWLHAGRKGVPFPTTYISLLFATMSRPTLGSTQFPIQWGEVSVKRPERETDHSPPLPPKLIIRGAIPPLSHKPSWPLPLPQA